MQLVFMHIPKTGGTYMREVMAPVVFLNGGPKHTQVFDEGSCLSVAKSDRALIYLNHATFRSGITRHVPSPGYHHALSYPENYFDGHVICAIVRNPFDWLVSYWGHAMGSNPKYRNPDHYDYECALRGFDYMVQTIINREGPMWPNNRFIHFALWSDSGRFMPDWILRQESLDLGIALIAWEFDLDYIKAKPRRAGRRIRDYRGYYTDRLVHEVEATWKSELDLLGYNFSGVKPSILKFRISEQIKQECVYDYENNRLTWGGD